MAKLAVITGRKEHAARINEAWQQGIDAVVETGMRLEDAKGTLPHGEYEEMVRTDLNFSPQTALKLRAIASNRVLSNPAHVRDLPPSWGTLSELAVVANKGYDLEAGIESGSIHPRMERKDVKALLPPPQRDDDLEEPDEEGDLPAAKPDEDEPVANPLVVAWAKAGPEARRDFVRACWSEIAGFVQGRTEGAAVKGRKTRWIRDDGGQPAGVRGGCVVRAIAIATGKPHREVHQELIEATRRYVSTHRNRVVEWIKRSRGARGYDPLHGSYAEIYGPYLEKHLGWQRVSYNARLRADELPPGRLIVEVHRHLVAVIDGLVHDTYNSGGAGRRPVKAFYISPVEAEVEARRAAYAALR
jgi:hypothetical protein